MASIKELILRETEELCLNKKEEKLTRSEMRMIRNSENPFYVCGVCDGYNYNCPGYGECNWEVIIDFGF